MALNISLAVSFELNLSVDMLSVGMVKEIFVVDGVSIFYLQQCKIDKQHSNLNCLEISFCKT